MEMKDNVLPNVQSLKRKGNCFAEKEGIPDLKCCVPLLIGAVISIGVMEAFAGIKESVSLDIIFFQRTFDWLIIFPCILENFST